MNINKIAQAYVTLTHKLDLHMPGYIDAYYGPNELRLPKDATKEQFSLEGLVSETTTLLRELDGSPITAETELRVTFLKAQLKSALEVIKTLEGKRLSFEDETLGIYQAGVSPHNDQYFIDVHEELEKRLAGVEARTGIKIEGNLGERLNKFYGLFIIPRDKVESAIRLSVTESRTKTKEHISLPGQESFELEFVKGVTWKAYNYYERDGRSRFAINIERDITLLEAIVFSCHEGYPGHHTYNTLFDAVYAKRNGWVEFSVYPLFSPMSVMLEGLAKYAEAFTFTTDEKVDLLLRLSEETGVSERLREQGVSKLPDLFREYLELSQIHAKLDYGKVESARKVYEGSREEEVVRWVMEHELLPEPDAKKRIGFIKGYGSYITTYLSGLELITRFVETKRFQELEKGASDSVRAREHTWQTYIDLLLSPPLLLPLQEYIAKNSW